MALIVVGVNHRTAPLEVRERLARPTRELAAAAEFARTRCGASEAVLLSTCNRTELYLVEGEGEAIPDGWRTLSHWLAGDAEPFGYALRDRDCVAHLFRVASGLDSMVLGEAQIQGQVRDAWEHSRATTGPVLNRLFQTALVAASRVRTETGLGRGAASVSSAAVQLAKKIFGSLQGRGVMVLGAGEMAELALQCLVEEGVRASIVANRTFERARQLAERYGATAMRHDECWRRLHEVDVLLCSTAAPHAVVSRAHVEPSLAVRGDRPLCILDIALPRDVEPAVAALDNVFLYDLDDLRAVASSNLEMRSSERPAAEAIVVVEVERFWTWRAGLAAVPTLTQLRSEMDRLRQRELEHAMRRLAHLPTADREAVEHFSRALMNKFLHEPSIRLRAAASNGRGLGVVDAVRYLFGLHEDGRDPAEADASRRRLHDDATSSPGGDR